jgi:hypothetical protein
MEKEPLNLLKKLEPRLRRLRISFHTWLDEMLEVITEKVWCQQILGSVGNSGEPRVLFSAIHPKSTLTDPLGLFPRGSVMRKQLSSAPVFF